MGRDTLSLVQGTLDLMVLGILAGGPAHGYGIAEQVRQATTGEVVIQDGALYQALHRLERQGLLDAEWGAAVLQGRPLKVPPPRTTAAHGSTRSQ